ncbi:unnamed protein product [Cochlearia groenlandica]
MGHDNIAKLAGILMKLHKKSPSGWLCLHPRPDQQRRTIKLVRSDGSSQIYDRPVVVSDLTKDFPKHKICRSDTLYIGQKTQSLSESETLKLGLNYFLLPSDFFLNDLSFLSIASLKPPNQNGAVLVKKKHVRTNQHNSNNNHHQPFLIQKGGTGERLRIRVSEDFLSELIMEGRNNREIEKTEEEEDDDEEEEGRVCTTVKLKKDYVQLVGLRKWKPKLETITETKAMKEKKKKKEKEKEKRKKKFTVMKKRSCKESSSSSQIDSCAKRKLKSKTNKSVLS